MRSVLTFGLATTLVSITAPWAGAAEPQIPVFVEETASTGIAHVYDGPFEHFVGGGVAVFDCDGDRRPDIYAAGGSNPAGLYRNVSDHGGALRFVAVDAPAAALTGVTGAYPIDIDADGHRDLVVLRVGENVVFRGLGACRFERANEAWSIDGGDAWTTGFTATWEGDNPLPTLVFANYIDHHHPEAPAGGCADNVMLRPRAEGIGYDAPSALSPGWCALSALFSDWNRSGEPDLRISNDRQYYRDGEEQLWRAQPGETPSLYGREDGWQQLRIFGMGIASRDITGDGYPEVFMTSMADNKLRTLDSVDDTPRPTYRDIAFARGVTAQRPHTGDDVRVSTAWHADFGDVNNDGLPDLFIAKGNVDAMKEAAERDPNNLLLGRTDGTFVERAVEAGVASGKRGRGGSLVDLNADGRLDLVVVNRRAPLQVWRNTGAGSDADGGWLALALEQEGANGDGIGAWLEVRVGDTIHHREVTCGGGHASGTASWIHVGLGEAEGASVRITWPGGETGAWVDLPAGAFATLNRDGGVDTWSPG